MRLYAAQSGSTRLKGGSKALKSVFFAAQNVVLRGSKAVLSGSLRFEVLKQYQFVSALIEHPLFTLTLYTYMIVRPDEIEILVRVRLCGRNSVVKQRILGTVRFSWYRYVILSFRNRHLQDQNVPKR